ncbi:MAG TPA: hypothetical protein VK641_01175, partial [Terriglobales bacterium]|nr:hypothetical protein [Terriglobales bacterium]
MTSRTSRRVLSALAPIMGLLFFANAGFAQQVTYYDFDAPQASNSSSLSCADPAKVPSAPTNPLFCFNNGGGTNP